MIKLRQITLGKTVLYSQTECTISLRINGIKPKLILLLSTITILTLLSCVCPSAQHYNMVMAAAAAASASDDHELLLNRFLPYSTPPSSSSQLYLNHSASSSATSLSVPTNGASSSGSSSSLVSSGSLRDAHPTHSSLHSGSHSSHTHPGVVANRSSAEAAVAAIYGGIPDVISLD